MSQASRYVATRRIPALQLPADILESIRGATLFTIPGEKHHGARFPDGSTASKVGGRWIVTDEQGTRDLTDTTPDPQ